ncbi:WAT1-related protein [Spatholobus suberectus]|nr:WAT1-related protein [Spatholobus suberectus]
MVTGVYSDVPNRNAPTWLNDAYNQQFVVSTFNNMKNIRNVLQGLKPEMLMVFAQTALAAVNVIYKLAIKDGMSMRVAIAYRLLLASAFSIPLALIFDRKKRPKITWRVLIMGFLCGLFGGSLYLNLYLEALALTSTTSVLAVTNLTPIITFIMAISFGFEKLNLRVAEGMAKVIGTIIGTSGAMLLIFFKGIEIKIVSSKINLMDQHQNQNVHIAPQHSDSRSNLLGVSCAIASCCCFSTWFNIQAKLNKECPSYHSSTALTSTMGAIQAIVFALCVDRDWNQWKLNNNIRLLTVVYSGIVVSGVMVMAIAWSIKMRDPLFVSVFNPLQLLLVVVAAYLMLDEKLYLGSVLGAVLIVFGLYVVLWGKSKEMKKKSQLEPSEITNESENVEAVAMSMPGDHDN